VAPSSFVPSELSTELGDADVDGGGTAELGDHDVDGLAVIGDVEDVLRSDDGGVGGCRAEVGPLMTHARCAFVTTALRRLLFSSGVGDAFVPVVAESSLHTQF
jgi:hypothetical protein